MKITIVGTGYVGLVTGTCFAEMGTDVCCVDVDMEKISALQQGIPPIYEQGLAELLKKNLQKGRIGTRKLRCERQRKWTQETSWL